MYQVLRPSKSEFVPVRGLQYHVRRWGPLQAGIKPPLVLLHGWMDVAASWQFMIDAFDEPFMHNRQIIAPDWRGFGLTQVPSVDCFWFPDYLADLDALLNACCPGQVVDLVGHSMGGNVAMFFAGVRPERIHRLVNLEGFGLPSTRPGQAPARMTQWLNALQDQQSGNNALKSYPDVQSVAARLMKTNPRLAQVKAQWLAHHWARPDEQGLWHVLGHDAHKVVNPYIARVEEVLATYRCITAPLLSIEASDDSLHTWWKGRYTREEFRQRLQSVAHCQTAVIDDAGHMLHHDQPHTLARLLEPFLQGGPTGTKDFLPG
jgi:pimeloyl-ACP methyl ester carboxylesterase